MIAPRVIARTQRWLAVDKPAGLLTIPGRGPGKSLVEWARAEHGDVWVVHRLDRETSGVVLLALTVDAHREACLWFEKRQVTKYYDCLVSGRAAAPMMRLDQPIEGSRSLTQVQARERFAEGFLARARPLTGRTHQIRIHLSGAGNPILGDTKYGGPPSVLSARTGARLEVPRVALHASRLELPGGEFFEAAWPEDFAAWMGWLVREGTPE